MIDLSVLPFAVPDLPAAEYHNTWPALSHSGMVKLLDTCPAQFHYDSHHPKDDDTPAKEIGTAYHMLVLENPRFHTTYDALPEGVSLSTKAGKDARDAIVAAGKTPLKFEVWETLRAMKLAIDAHPFVGPLFNRIGMSEVSLFWKDPASEVICRARPDFLPAESRLIVDLKSALDASPEALSKQMSQYGYNVEAALYTEGAYACGIRDTDAAFVFVAQQKDPPYIITAWTPDDDAMKLGRRQVQKARALYADCLRTNTWPPYVTEVAQIGLPAWAKRQLEQME